MQSYFVHNIGVKLSNYECVSICFQMFTYCNALKNYEWNQIWYSHSSLGSQLRCGSKSRKHSMQTMCRFEPRPSSTEFGIRVRKTELLHLPRKQCHCRRYPSDDTKVALPNTRLAQYVFAFVISVMLPQSLWCASRSDWKQNRFAIGDRDPFPIPRSDKLSKRDLSGRKITLHGWALLEAHAAVPPCNYFCHKLHRGASLFLRHFGFVRSAERLHLGHGVVSQGLRWFIDPTQYKVADAVFRRRHSIGNSFRPLREFRTLQFDVLYQIDA